MTYMDYVGSVDCEALPAADDAWTQMLEVLLDLWPSYVARCAEHRLPPTQAHALLRLTTDDAMRMRDLADLLGLDPSTVTGVVHRLEERGLVRRVRGPDRRERLVAATERGLATRQALVQTLRRAPGAIARLAPEQQERIAVALMALERPDARRPQALRNSQ
jgi:DNA-binding MarR family transcriptional regulator